MNEYILQNKNTKNSQVFFSIRSTTLDLNHGDHGNMKMIDVLNVREKIRN